MEYKKQYKISMNLRVCSLKNKQGWQTFSKTHQNKQTNKQKTKRERTQINKIRNKEGKVTTDTKNLQRIVSKECYWNTPK